MKIALLGYGKMGKEIEKIALQRNHKIVLKIDIDNAHELTPANLSKADVAIDFSIPDTAYDNIVKCFSAGTPIVSGTTGWLDRYDEVITKCKANQNTFFYASNYSLGVNIFFAINKALAKLMNPFSDYDVSLEEIHHIHKLDAPSGTAITLAEDLIENIERKDAWELDGVNNDKKIAINAIRENEVPGTHSIKYNSDVDYIEIKHLAKNRRGFALGAVLASEFILGKKGVFTMDDIMNAH